MSSSNRLTRDGLVAVLYSPRHGAGWSTWNGLGTTESMDMLFDPVIADIVAAGEPDWVAKVRAVTMIKYPGAYLGGLEDLQVQWLPLGTHFRITEYDGAEVIETRDDIEWTVA